MNPTADDLRELPTLSVSQADDLKLDDGTYRYWLCRCGVEDGMPYDDAITVEKLIDGRWVTIDQYPGGEG